MCGRASQTKKKVDPSHRFALQINEADLEPVYNAAPTQQLQVITNQHPDKLQAYTWGIPIVVDGKDKQLSNSRFNKLLTWDYYRYLFSKGQTCLVLADGFYEWQKKSKDAKIPYRFELKNKDVFAMAGLWDTILDKRTGQKRNFFSVITVDPNNLIGAIHDRMPAILTPGEEMDWLVYKSNNQYYLDQLKAYPVEEMQSYTISNKINSPGYNSPDILIPYEWPKQPEQLSLF